MRFKSRRHGGRAMTMTLLALHLFAFFSFVGQTHGFSPSFIPQQQQGQQQLVRDSKWNTRRITTSPPPSGLHRPRHRPSRRHTVFIMRDASMVRDFAVGDRVKIKAGVVLDGKDWSGLEGTITYTWEKYAHAVFFFLPSFSFFRSRCAEMIS